MVNRVLTEKIIKDLKPGHVTVLYGARRTGKTVLMNFLKEKLSHKKILLLHGEDLDVVTALSSSRQDILKNLVSGYDFLFLDEALGIPGVGRNLKLLVDTQPKTGVFVTGSASFELRNQIGEPLVGRSRIFHLFPYLLSEVTQGYMDAYSRLPQTLVFGLYPQVIGENTSNSKREILENIRNGYLLKDVLALDNLKDSVFILNLLKYLAFQIGNDVSMNEIANSLGTTVKTVQRYLDILEKAFVIFKIQGFSRNLRKEISKAPRFYFWDNGIRNVVISNTNPLESRDDVGKLWENFCISERIKIQNYKRTWSNFFFWRTYDQQEIDLLEEHSGDLKAFEMKWKSKKVKVPKAFRDNYSDVPLYQINRENFYDFLNYRED